MKKTLNNLFILAFVCMAAGCASRDDSKQIAKEQNEENLKNTGLEGMMLNLRWALPMGA